jgi:hypothetical protein
MPSGRKKELIPIDTNRGRYSEEEFALILKRAAELQDRADGSMGLPSATSENRPPADGLTLAEARDIAGEVGLEPEFIDRAAASLALIPPETNAGLLGGPLAIHLAETLDRPLTEAERLGVIDVVRRVLAHEGHTSEVMGSVEWRSVGRIDGIMVTVDSSEESASVRVVDNLSGIAALTWIGSITAGLVAGFLTIEALHPTSLLVSASILGAGGSAGVGLARAVWSRTTKAFRKKVERLRDEIERHLSG